MISDDEKIFRDDINIQVMKENVDNTVFQLMKFHFTEYSNVFD
jgi:hypothetical protein